MTHPMQFVLTGKELDLKFDSPKCKNCTVKAVSEFTVSMTSRWHFLGAIKNV